MIDRRSPEPAPVARANRSGLPSCVGISIFDEHNRRLFMHGSLASWLRRRILSIAFVGFVLCAGAPARAGITVSVQSVSAGAGTTGDTLEVDVQNTGASVNIAAFSFEISVPFSSGVTFTGADISTSLATYIFAGNSFFGPDIAFNTGTTLDAGDLAIAGSTTLGTGETLGLGLVSFDVAAGTPLGPVTVSLTGFPFTSLTDPNQGNVAIDVLETGTITITGAAVPEPSSLVSATLGLLGVLWLRRMRAESAGSRILGRTNCGGARMERQS
jgi:PEP-CTERM motif